MSKKEIQSFNELIGEEDAPLPTQNITYKVSADYEEVDQFVVDTIKDLYEKKPLIIFVNSKMTLKIVEKAIRNLDVNRFTLESDE